MFGVYMNMRLTDVLFIFYVVVLCTHINIYLSLYVYVCFICFYMVLYVFIYVSLAHIIITLSIHLVVELTL